MGRTRGSEPPDRIRRKEARGGGLRRRTLAARKRGNGGGATRIKFKVVGVSPGFKEFISGVGWGRATPWRSGDERRPPGASGDGDKPMAGDGIARERFGETLGSSRTVSVRVVDELGPDDGARLRAAAETEQRRGARRIVRQEEEYGGGAHRRGRSGVGDAEGVVTRRAAPSLTRPTPRLTRPLAQRGSEEAVAGRAASGWQQWRGWFERGEDETRGEGAGFIGEEERSVWRRETDIGGQASSAGAALAVKERQVVTAAVVGEKGKKGREKSLAPLPLWEEGERENEGEEHELCLLVLEGCGMGASGPSDDSGDDG
uniref:Epstein-Barr virus EBNA-1-like protein n=1 Tax=Oryza sativa subsp. japonica TaxID=39947 RepID=Q5QLP2_ORYSJ|nr:Epstein-Barr virus EBNA-1-like protein [Oryza sativa Japonica Group]